MSSAEIASTTPIDCFLICRALSRDPRMPVTTISCSVEALVVDSGTFVSAAGAVAWARRPAPSGGRVVAARCSVAGLPRRRRACGFALEFPGGALAPSAPLALVAAWTCASAVIPKVSEPSARLDRPTFDGTERLMPESRALFLSAFLILRDVFRLIRHLPLKEIWTLR